MAGHSVHCWCGQPHPITTHGTVAGYRRELKLRREGHDVQPCPACTKAGNTYVQAWRDRHPGSYRQSTGKQQCRDRALRQLAREYPVRFSQLYDAEVREARRVESDQGATTAA